LEISGDARARWRFADGFFAGFRAAFAATARRPRFGSTWSVSPMFSSIANCSDDGLARWMRSSAMSRRASVISLSRSAGSRSRIGSAAIARSGS